MARPESLLSAEGIRKGDYLVGTSIDGGELTYVPVVDPAPLKFRDNSRPVVIIIDCPDDTGPYERPIILTYFHDVVHMS